MLASVARWYERDYELIYLHSLGFRFDSSGHVPNIGRRLIVDLGDYFTLMRKYHGVKLVQSKGKIGDEWKLLNNQISRGNPVAATIDTSYIPYVDRFITTHNLNHIIMFVGIDVDKKEIYCADPYFLQQDIPLSFEHLLLAYRDIITIEKEADQEICLEQICHDALQFLQKLSEQNPYADMVQFAESLPSLDFTAEMEDCANFGETQLFLKLSSISRGRSNYARMLTYLREKYALRHLDTAANELKQLANRWNSIRGVITKLHIIQKRRASMHAALLNDLMQSIKEAADAEEQWIDRLMEIFTNREIDHVETTNRNVEQDKISDQQQEQIVVVDLDHLFNNRAFASEFHPADLDSEGYYFAEPPARSDSNLHVENMCFKMSANPQLQYDNLTCLGQSVVIDMDYYSSIMILGCSEMGSYQEQLKIIYEDQSSETRTIGFSDWWSYHPVNHEVVAWKSKAAQRDKGILNHDGHLYALRISVNPQKKLRSIQLPAMPNIHIFSLSLSKASEET